MRLIKKYNQNRRDCYIDIECEGCGHEAKEMEAYDDRNFWDNVLPDMKCEKRGKSTKVLGLDVDVVHTRYPDGHVV